MKKELAALEANHTWDVADLRLRKKALGSKMAF